MSYPKETFTVEGDGPNEKCSPEGICHPHRKRPAAGQDPVKRDQILDGAWRVFERMGFDAASMNDITREAGVSKGTIYVYFSSKEELFEALVDKYRAKFIAGVYETLSSNVPVREVLTEFGLRLVRKTTSHMAVSGQRVVIGVTERMPEIGQHFYRKGPCQGLRLLAQFFAEQADKGRLVIDDADLAAHQFSSLCQAGLFRRRLFGDMPEEPTDAEIDHVVTSAVDMFMKSYGAEAAAAN